MDSRTEITVIPPSRSPQRVAWFGTPADEAVRALIADAAGTPPEELVATLDGRVIALTAAIPSGTTLDVRSSTTSPHDDDEQQHGDRALFRQKLVRFETVQAHLANERTFLAWVRTALAALSIAFALLALVGAAQTEWLAAELYVLGTGFVVAVGTTFVAGWLRFARVRDVLFDHRAASSAQSSIPPVFHRVGVSTTAYYLATLCGLLTAVYLAAGTQQLV